MRARSRCYVALLALSLLLAACGTSGGQTPLPPTVPAARPFIVPAAAAAASAPSAQFRRVRVRLAQIGILQQPTVLAVCPGDQALYVAEQAGRVRAIRNSRVDPAPVLDLTGQVRSGGEQGLLGLAFSPDSRRLYVDFTDIHGDTHMTEYAMRGRRADPASERLVLKVDQPFANHNGGQLAFGPDGWMYIALGDGGGAEDQAGNGQSLGTLLGKLLRIDPRPRAGRPYAVPVDNPFVGRTGAARRFGPMGCATRGASRSTRPPAICG